MNLDRLDNGMKIAAGSAIALLVFMFFPWYGLTSEAFDREFGVNVTAWRAFDFIDLILLIVAVLVIGAAFAQATGRRLRLPVDTSVAVAALGILATVLVVYRLIDTPFDLDRKYGLFLGVLAVVGLVVGGRMAMSARGASFAEARDQMSEQVSQARDQAAGSIATGGPHYEDWSRDELYEEATKRDIEGRSEMNKDELVRALRAKQRSTA